MYHINHDNLNLTENSGTATTTQTSMSNSSCPYTQLVQWNLHGSYGWHHIISQKKGVQLIRHPFSPFEKAKVSLGPGTQRVCLLPLGLEGMFKIEEQL